MAFYPIADAHCDFLFGMYQKGYDIKSLKDGQAIYLPYMREGGVKLQFFAAWIDRQLKTPYLQQCISMIDAYKRMLKDNSEHMTHMTKDYTPGSDKIACVLSVEGGEAIEGSLAVLRILKSLGVSSMTLTWNFSNELSGSAIKGSHKGLTQLGREVLREMADIGVAVDVSHLSDSGIDDVLSYSDIAPFASHSNAREVFYSPRSLKDEHIKEIGRRKGVVGVNFYYEQLTSRQEASISDIVKHIVHIAKVGSINCCAIGSDFDGMIRYPKDIANCSHFPKLLKALQAEGFSDSELERVAFYNLYEYIRQYAD